MKRFAKTVLFIFSALVLLVVGSFGAQALWQLAHHRYDEPSSGYYHGSVSALFTSAGDETYSFQFKGKSEPHWRWARSTNIVYQRLNFDWVSYVEVNKENTGFKRFEGSGEIILPSLAYESASGNGSLTRAALAEWLLGPTNRPIGAMQSVDAIFRFIQDAGRGVLPAPRHHSYYFDSVGARIEHSLPGFGVGGFVYIWIGLWMILVALFARRFWNRPVRS